MGTEPDWLAEFRALNALGPDAAPAARADRGRRFERILHRMLADSGLAPRLSYRPRGEEVDGSFLLDGRTMLLEAKWTTDPQPASSLYQFMGKVSGKLVGTIGLFISMSGFSTDAVDALVAGKDLNLILMDGGDLRSIVQHHIDVADAIRLKLRAAAESGTPFLALETGSARQGLAPVRPEAVLVEGRIDEHVLTPVIREWGTRARIQSVVPVGGPSNFAPIAEALTSTSNGLRLIVVADGGTAATKERIRNDLRQKEIDATVVFIEPSLEAALGLVESDESAHERRRLLRLDDHSLLAKIEGNLKTVIPDQPRGIRDLFKVLGIQPPPLT